MNSGVEWSGPPAHAFGAMNEFINSPTLSFNSSSDSGFNIDCAIGK